MLFRSKARARLAQGSRKARAGLAQGSRKALARLALRAQGSRKARAGLRRARAGLRDALARALREPCASLAGALDVLHPESKQQTTPAEPRDALECVSLRWPARAKTGKTASALRIADLRSTDSTCSSSSATWNDVRFELKHRARMGAT